jgi:hypothetical protein
MTTRLPPEVVAELLRRGYRIEVSSDGQEEWIIRPDGSVAILASNKKGCTQ